MELNMKEYLCDTSPMSSYIEEAIKIGAYIKPKTLNSIKCSE